MTTGPITAFATGALVLFALAWWVSGVFRHRIKIALAVLAGFAVVLILLDATDSPLLTLLQAIDYTAIARTFDVPD